MTSFSLPQEQSCESCKKHLQKQCRCGIILLLSRYSIAVITPVSQTGDAGSTPVICLKSKPVNTPFAGFFLCQKRHLVFIWSLFSPCFVLIMTRIQRICALCGCDTSASFWLLLRLKIYEQRPVSSFSQGILV